MVYVWRWEISFECLVTQQWSHATEKQRDSFFFFFPFSFLRSCHGRDHYSGLQMKTTRQLTMPRTEFTLVLEMSLLEELGRNKTSKTICDVGSTKKWTMFLVVYYYVVKLKILSKKYKKKKISFAISKDHLAVPAMS